MRERYIHETRTKFAEVFNDAYAGEPQRITRYGRDPVIMIAESVWNELKKRAKIDDKGMEAMIVEMKSDGHKFKAI